MATATPTTHPTIHPHTLQADGGALYRWVLLEQDTLCPDTCWHPDEEEGEEGEGERRWW